MRPSGAIQRREQGSSASTYQAQDASSSDRTPPQLVSRDVLREVGQRGLENTVTFGDRLLLIFSPGDHTWVPSNQRKRYRGGR